MKPHRCKWVLTSSVLAVCMLLGALEVSGEDAKPSLGQKYKTALSLYDQGDYAGARTLLLEIKDTVQKENLQLNPATQQEIERRLAEIDKRLETKPAPAVPETVKVDPAKLTKLDAAKSKYNVAQTLMREKKHEEALNLFTEVKADLDQLEAEHVKVGVSDRSALESNIAACKDALALAAAPAPKAEPAPQPTVVAEAEPAPTPTPKVEATPEPAPKTEPTPAPTPTAEPAPAPAPTPAAEPTPTPAEVKKETPAEEPGVLVRGTETGRFNEALTADAIRIQLEEQEVRTKLSDGIVFLRENDFRRAEQKFVAAQLQVKYGDFPTDFKRKWLAVIQDHLDMAAKQKDTYNKTTEEGKNRAAADRLTEELLRMKEQQMRTKDRLQEQWVTFFGRGQYEDALNILDRMREVDPEDPAILEKIKMTSEKKLEAWRHKSQMERIEQEQYHYAGNIEQMTPWYPVAKYPDNWKELSDRRLKAVEKAQITEKPGDRKVRQQLEETVVSFTFNEQPVMEALDFLQTLGNVNIVPDRSKFEDPNKTITLKLTNVSLETAIKLLTEQLGLKWIIRDGIVFISDEEGIKRPPETNAYDVRDLLADIPNFSGPTFELQNIAGNRGGRGSTGGTGGTSIFSEDTGTKTQEEAGKSADESLNDLIDLIKQVIESGTWDEGSGNAIRGRAGNIIVTHTPETQAKVQKLLEDLRKARALQVSIDIRFITLTDTFLESMGFDITGAGNLAASPPHYVDTDGDGVPDTSLGIEFDRTVVGGNWTTLSNITNTFGTGVAGLGSAKGLTGTGGLHMMASFLDDFEVNFILDAVQQSRRSTLLNAPKLTMMNGQRAYIAVSRQQNFVQSVTAEVSEGAVGYTPDIGTVQDGIVFDVRPTVSADRRYVQMDLRPSIAVIERIDNFQVVTPGVLFGGAQIQLPVISATVVRATVSCPDGGTLLIGGLNFAFDNELESGVPILSKIPILGKLFTRRGFTTERQNVVILVKPTIIIQEEKEEEVK